MCNVYILSEMLNVMNKKYYKKESNLCVDYRVNFRAG